MRVISKPNSVLSKVEHMLYDAFTNNGICGLPTEDKAIVQLTFADVFDLPRAAKEANVELKDTVFTKDLNRFIETTVTKVIREAIEPNLVIIPNLFQSVNYNGSSRSVEIGGIGAFHAATVPEGSEYPEVEWNYAEGDMVQIGIEKHGLKMRVSQEIIDDNLFDVFGLWLRMAGRAMARHKEEYGLKLVNDFGLDLFDNDSPNTSELGSTTGRNIAGAKNNTMSLNDIFEMYAFMAMRGFTPDTLIMNPLAWKMFMTDPETREIVMKGATLSSNRMPNGSAAAGFGTSHMGYGLNTAATGISLEDPNKVAGNNPFVTTLNPMGATFNIEPRYLPSPLKVLVTPYMAYTPAEGATKAKTSIAMADSTRCGIVLNKEGVSLDEWNDPERDIKAMKIKERWGMALFEQGKGVGISRNITIDRNYAFENVNQVTLNE